MEFDLKKRAITAGLVVDVDPDEAEILGIAAMDVVSDDVEQELMSSRFDPCEHDLENIKIETN